MHSIFGIRDILDEICSWLGRGDLAATIRVNKAWSEASVGPLWRCVHLRHALKLLGPIDLRNGFERFYTFSENITLDSWSRFIYYARYVRILRVVGADSSAILVAKKSRSCLLKNEPNYFFPNCQFLHYFTTPEQLDPEDHLNALLPPTLDHIYLGGMYVRRIWFNNFCKVLVTELSSLRLFILDPNPLEDQVAISDSFDSLLTKFTPTLTHVQLPRILLARATIEKLSHFQSLNSLFVEGCQLFEEPVIMNKFAIRNDGSGSFMSLKSIFFSVTTSTPPVLEFFRPFSFPALTALSLCLGSVEFDLSFFLATIVRQCPSLEILELVLRRNRETKVPWSSITPLLGCRNLVSLVLHYGGVDMTLHNLVELLKSRQAPLHWHTLEITTYQPFHFQDVLLTVAKYSSRINTLGLDVCDENSVRPFGNILPPNASEMNVQAHLEFTDQLSRTGFSFLSLSCLTLVNDSGFRPETVMAIASLLLRICKGRVEVAGYDMDSLRQVVGHITAFYEKLGKLARGAMPVEAGVVCTFIG